MEWTSHSELVMVMGNGLLVMELKGERSFEGLLVRGYGLLEWDS